MKALIDLQTAVNKNDVANIPAKVAAAQAVVETKEDRYLLAQMQLKAALSANNNAGVAAAVDAIVASGYNNAADNSKLYQSLGATYMNNKQYADAAAAFQKAAAADATDWRSAALAGEALLAGGQKDQAITPSSARFRPAQPPGTNPKRICTSARLASLMKSSRRRRPTSRGHGSRPIRRHRAGATPSPSTAITTWVISRRPWTCCA